jgi:hypothetical protein
MCRIIWRVTGADTCRNCASTHVRLTEVIKQCGEVNVDPDDYFDVGHWNDPVQCFADPPVGFANSEMWLDPPVFPDEHFSAIGHCDECPNAEHADPVVARDVLGDRLYYDGDGYWDEAEQFMWARKQCLEYEAMREEEIERTDARAWEGLQDTINHLPAPTNGDFTTSAAASGRASHH